MVFFQIVKLTDYSVKLKTLELNFNRHVKTNEGPPTPTQVFSCGFQKKCILRCSSSTLSLSYYESLVLS